ncbi:MAG TPA: LytTR family DNA-binding domain-containing protein [Opitutus sp.]|nr:LytTR family DNA-binding domain-containing protein [Opitutus sp.]
MRALIIEDNAGARADLRAMLAAHGKVEVVGEAASMATAQRLLARDDYELVLLDVQIVGGSGFDLIQWVRPAARVIFVTAHDDHAVRAFEVNALDYVVKPVQAGRLAAALARVAVEPEPGPGGAALRTDDLVHLRSGGSARFVTVAHIGAIQAQENYSFVWLVDGTRVLMRRSLKDWMGVLPADKFMRVHRTMIVNLAHVVGYDREGAKNFSLRLRGFAGNIPVGRETWPEVKARLRIA